MDKKPEGKRLPTSTAFDTEAENALKAETGQSVVPKAQSDASYAPDSDMDIRVEYANRRRRQTYATVPFLIVLLGLVLSGFPDLGVVTGLGLDSLRLIVAVVVLAFFGYSLVNWRCPSCNAYFGHRLNPQKCSRCGVELRD